MTRVAKDRVAVVPARPKRLPACSSRIQLHEVCRAIGVEKPPLDRCEPSEQVAKLLRAVGARNTDDALTRIERLKKAKR